jgi:carbonic anhydrase/acetyltransferase-like protein (isoleucine patch superfamily)
LKSCTIEDSAFVGMRATVQEGAVVKTGAFISAGAVVSAGTTVPSGVFIDPFLFSSSSPSCSGEVWAGCPAVFQRKCTVGEIDTFNAALAATTKLASLHADENSKSFAEVEQERLQRQLLEERDADYDSSLGRSRHAVYYLMQRI